jgi:hypothetical protein
MTRWLLRQWHAAVLVCGTKLEAASVTGLQGGDTPPRVVLLAKLVKL